MKVRYNLWKVVGRSLALTLLVGMILFPLLVSAGPTLPPRNPPPADAPPPSDDDDDDGGPLIAHIVLQSAASGWGVVQWQNSAGGWEDVEGWQGSVSTNSRWAVLAKDFGTGPFRWVVKSGPGGSIVSESAPFDLPGGAGEVVGVSLP